MKTIYKYDLKILDKQNLSLPKGSRMLCVNTQGGYPKLWAMVDNEENEKTEYTIATRGTGHNCSYVDDMDYIGTYLIEDDSLVFHVFAKANKEQSK